MSSKKKIHRRTPKLWVDGMEEMHNVNNFLDRLTMLYGPSKTGKTIYVRQIMHTLRDHIPEASIFTATTLNFPFIEGPYVHEKVDIDILEQIWDRQGARTDAYLRANNLITLKKLAYRIPSQKVAHFEAMLQGERARIISRNLSNRESMEKNVDMMLQFLYKMHIRHNLPSLRRMNLSDDELFSIEYRDLNPRHLLVFDDVTASLKKFQKKEVIQNIFYAARNRFLTVLIGIHDDKLIDAELRKNAHMTIFTTPNIMRVFFKRECMGIDPDVTKAALKIAAHTEAFDEEKHTKILYFKERSLEEGTFVRTVAKRYEKLSFGSEEYHRFAREAIQFATAREDNVHREEYGL